MPKTKNTTEYATFRNMQVYEEAVAEAQLEEGISEKERALLIRLRDTPGISESDAETIEQELTANQASRVWPTYFNQSAIRDYQRTVQPKCSHTPGGSSKWRTERLNALARIRRE